MNAEFTAAFFDDASAEWRQNKKPVKGGGFAYRCTYIHSDGKNCAKAVESHTNERRLHSGHPEWTKKSPFPDLFCRRHKRRFVQYTPDNT
jgi:hypothetical protein